MSKLVVLAIVLLMVPMVTPGAVALRPYTHVVLANEVLDSIGVDEDEGEGGETVTKYFVTVGGRDYKLNETVALALLDHPEYFRGGAAGAASYPDFAFGACMLFGHCEQGTSMAYAHEWMRHLWEASWDYPDGDGAVWSSTVEEAQVKAFVYGYLLHVTNEMWAADGLNGGLLITAPINRLTVDSYVDQHAPSDTEVEIAAPLSFIRQLYIQSKFTDSSGRTAHDMGRLGQYERMMDLKVAVGRYIDEAEDWLEELDDGGVCDVTTDEPSDRALCEGLKMAAEYLADSIGIGWIVTVLEYIVEKSLEYMLEFIVNYYTAWRDGISSGLAVWERVSRDATADMAARPGGHPFDTYDSFTDGSRYGTRFPEMLGRFENIEPLFPDSVWIEILDLVPGVEKRDVLEALFFVVGWMIANDLSDRALEGTLGDGPVPSAADHLFLPAIDLPNEQLTRTILSEPELYASDFEITVDGEEISTGNRPSLLEFLDGQMGITGNQKWSVDSFAAARHAVDFGKLSLLAPGELNWWLCAHGVGLLYEHTGGPLPDCFRLPDLEPSLFETCLLSASFRGIDVTDSSGSSGAGGDLSGGSGFPGTSSSFESSGVDSECAQMQETYDPRRPGSLFPFLEDRQPSANLTNLWIRTEGVGARLDLATHHEVGQALRIRTSISTDLDEGVLVLRILAPDEEEVQTWHILLPSIGSAVQDLPVIVSQPLSVPGTWTLNATFANAEVFHNFEVHDPYLPPVPVPDNMALDFIRRADGTFPWEHRSGFSHDGLGHPVYMDCPARGRAWHTTFVDWRAGEETARRPTDAVQISQTPPPRAWAEVAQGPAVWNNGTIEVGAKTQIRLFVDWENEQFWGKDDYDLDYEWKLREDSPWRRAGRWLDDTDPGDRAVTFGSDGDRWIRFHAGGLCADDLDHGTTVGNLHVLHFRARGDLGPYPGETTFCLPRTCPIREPDPAEFERNLLIAEVLRELLDVIDPLLPDRPPGDLPEPGEDPAVNPKDEVPFLDRLPTAVKAVLGDKLDSPLIQDGFAFGGRSLTRIGVTLDAAERPDDAEKMYKWADYVGHKDPKTQMTLSHAFINRGDLDAATSHADKATALAPQDASAHVTKGVVHLAQNDGVLAEKSFRAALDREPLHSEALVGVAKAAQAQGDHREAVEYYDQALGTLDNTSSEYQVVEELRTQAEQQAVDAEGSPAPGTIGVLVLVLVVTFIVARGRRRF